MKLTMDIEITTISKRQRTDAWAISFRFRSEDYCRFGGSRVKVEGNLLTGMTLIPTEETDKGTWQLSRSDVSTFVYIPAKRILFAEEVESLYTIRRKTITAKLNVDGSWSLSLPLFDQPPRRPRQSQESLPQPSLLSATTLPPEPVQPTLQDALSTPMDNLRAALILANEALKDTGAVAVIKDDGFYGATFIMEL